MTVLVVGGGITGLAAAHLLGSAGIPTVLVEASDRLGGKVGTEQVDGFLIEHGPDSFVSYRPAGIRLAERLGLGGSIIGPLEPRTVHIRTGGALRPFPDGMGLVLPTRMGPFVRTSLFSWPEKLRVALDLALPREARAGDLGVGPFLERRLGRALVDRLAGPLLGGVYGTPIDQLSLDAIVPQLRVAEKRHRSLLLATLAEGRARTAARRAAADARGGPGSSSPPFVSLVEGTGSLVGSLADRVRSSPSVEVRTSTAVTELDPRGPGVIATFDRGRRSPFEAAVLATPAPIAARILMPVVPDAAQHLASIPHASTAVVTLAYRRADAPDAALGHGFLVADDEPLDVSACTISSEKWAGRAPADGLLIRAFVGSSRTRAHALPDEALAEAAHRDVAGALGLRSRPLFWRVSRHVGAMPQYTIGHLDRVARIEAALSPYPALRVVGGAYRGVGLPDCIAQGEAAAGSLMAHAPLVDRSTGDSPRGHEPGAAVGPDGPGSGPISAPPPPGSGVETAA